MGSVVAELGRPETPAETAARKAESSRRYRSSKTFRNLIAALIVTVGVVLVVIAAVPRGEPVPRPEPDVAAEATALSAELGRPVLSPSFGEGWRVNQATVEGLGGIQAWTMVYVRSGEPGFLRIAQGLDAGDSWIAQLFRGTPTTETVDIDGVTWDVYRPSEPDRSGNIAYGLATPAGPDSIAIYGDASPETTAAAASAVADQVRQMKAE